MDNVNVRIEHLKAEWDIEKNHPIIFSDLSKGSDKKVWWICHKGHSWRARFSNRVNGSDCPICAHRMVLFGENDLLTTYPHIAKEWNPTKNGELKPENVLPHSNKTVWWVCNAGHEWQAKINNRTSHLTQCPYCAKTIATAGENDLATLFPTIASEWNTEKNGDLKPEHFLPNSNCNVWWRCKNGHEWQTKIYHRVSGTSCPYCAGQKAIPGQTDLATMFPDISAQWHPTKNGAKTPNDYTAHSHTRVWWICSEGHEWESTITNRVKCGCPYCGNRAVLPGYNDLATLWPNLLDEWEQELNGELKPSEVLPHSNTPVYWICNKKHIWRTSPNNRVNGMGCPFCNRNQLIADENSLAVRFPAIAKEWDIELNAPKLPKDVTAFCNDKYWWKCTLGHQWFASVSNRSKGKSCPYCSHRQPIPGENDFKSLYPQLALEWNFKRNKELLPEQFLPGSSKKVWWCCNKGHEWQATIFSRIAGGKCPMCNGRYDRHRSLI